MKTKFERRLDDINRTRHNRHREADVLAEWRRRHPDCSPEYARRQVQIDFAYRAAMLLFTIGVGIILVVGIVRGLR